MKGDIYTIGPRQYIEIERRKCLGPTCAREIAIAYNAEFDRHHPFDIEGKNAGHSHYATCPDAERFRKKKSPR